MGTSAGHYPRDIFGRILIASHYPRGIIDPCDAAD